MKLRWQTRWKRWVALWSERESATPLALVRLLVALTLFYDFSSIAFHDLVPALYGPEGIGFGASASEPPLMFRVLGVSDQTAYIMHGTAWVSSLLFGLGFFTRVSGVVLLFAYSQLAHTYGIGDRGIDMMLRHVIVLLLFSGSHETLSLDARIRHGRFVRPDALISAWPRFLLVAQVAWMYFSAGIHKTHPSWLPFGGSDALYYVLLDPHFARFDFSWITNVFPLIQLGTFATWVFELTAPLLLLATWYRRSEGDGRLRRVLAKIRFRELWIITGASFHVLLVVTIQLGIFPFGMLALYPAFFRGRGARLSSSDSESE